MVSRISTWVISLAPQKFIFNVHVKIYIFSIRQSDTSFSSDFRVLSYILFLTNPKFGLGPVRWLKNIFLPAFVMKFNFLNRDLLDIISACRLWSIDFVSSLLNPAILCITDIYFKQNQYARIQTYKR